MPKHAKIAHMSRSRIQHVNGAGEASGEERLVPSRRQYLDLKAQHPGAILLYRLGDFYETFDEDATILARVAGWSSEPLPASSALAPLPIPPSFPPGRIATWRRCTGSESAGAWPGSTL